MPRLKMANDLRPGRGGAMTPLQLFNTAAKTHLAPVAREFRLSFERIEDRVFAMRSKKVAVKIYFPEGNAFEMTVTLSQEFDPGWIAQNERALIWFIRFLGQEDRLPRRIGASIPHINYLVQGYAAPLAKVLARFSKASPKLWEQLEFFCEGGVAEKLARRHDIDSKNHKR